MLVGKSRSVVIGGCGYHMCIVPRCLFSVSWQLHFLHTTGACLRVHAAFWARRWKLLQWLCPEYSPSTISRDASSRSADPHSTRRTAANNPRCGPSEHMWCQPYRSCALDAPFCRMQANRSCHMIAIQGRIVGNAVWYWDLSKTAAASYLNFPYSI